MHIKEDAPVNAVGGGNIAGAGVPLSGKPSNWGEPGISPNSKKKTMILRRKPPVPLKENEMGEFAGHKTFIVPPEVFHNARLSKRKGAHWTKYLSQDDDRTKAIIDYHRKNKGKKPIILQDARSGAMMYAHYGKNK